ncbi:hypothetical protein KPH14_002608 [Odynerus spinipes]|uniref:Odorant receptor n=1 Tax=Odynerus spinipes TaxID=1348599 RepID=A0AAD9R888_9HYME|nr:hypothetical protein KPH14_002608 [Odynerus spinipes]
MDRAIDVIYWNKKLMSALGLWPHQRNNLWFAINFVYFTFLAVLGYVDLFLFIDDLEHVVMNVTENLAYSQVFVRIGMLWKYNDQLGSVISDMTKDFDERRYESREEKQAFLIYNARSKIFVKLLSAFVGVTAPLYFFTPLLASLSKGQPRVETGNVTEILYQLPYHFHVFYTIENTRTYFLTYFFEMPFVYTAGFGQTAADCLMVTLVFHICGQMSVLAVQINNINVDPCNCKKDIRKVIEAHVRLLRMSKKVAKAFNATLLAHLLGAMTLICVLGYQILTVIIFPRLYGNL